MKKKKYQKENHTKKKVENKISKVRSQKNGVCVSKDLGSVSKKSFLTIINFFAQF